MNLYELVEPDDQPDRIVNDGHSGYRFILKISSPEGPVAVAVDSLEECDDGDFVGMRDDEVVIFFSSQLPYVMIPRKLYRVLSEADLFERAQQMTAHQQNLVDWASNQAKTRYPKLREDEGYEPF